MTHDQIPNVTIAGEDLVDVVAEAVEKALAARLGPRALQAYFKVTNIAVDGGKVQRNHMAIEVRRRMQK